MIVSRVSSLCSSSIDSIAFSLKATTTSPFIQSGFPENWGVCLACIRERPKDALPPLRVLKTVEEAAEEFIDPSLTDPVEKLDNVLGVINKRARAVVVVLDYLARHK